MTSYKLPDSHWIEQAEKLRQHTPQIIKVESAMRILGYNSKSAAWYALEKMRGLGLVEHIEGNPKGEWRLP